MIGALAEVSNNRKQDRKSDTEKSRYASSKSFEVRPADAALREEHRTQRCFTDAVTSTGPEGWPRPRNRYPEQHSTTELALRFFSTRTLFSL